MTSGTKLSKFDIMRRNRPKVARARKSLRERIDELELDMEREWGEPAAGEIVQVAERLAEARERQLPKPRRRWFFFGRRQAA